MAMIKCPECKKEVSDKATACPHCGYNKIAEYVKEQNSPEAIEKRKKEDKISTIIGIICLIFLIIFFKYASAHEEKFNTTGTSSTHKCDYCGKEESGKKYKVTYLKGYNKDGTIKVEYDYVYIGDRCVRKARESGDYADIE